MGFTVGLAVGVAVGFVAGSVVATEVGLAVLSFSLSSDSFSYLEPLCDLSAVTVATLSSKSLILSFSAARKKF